MRVLRVPVQLCMVCGVLAYDARTETLKNTIGVRCQKMLGRAGACVYLRSNAAEREECVYLHSNAAEREKILMKIRMPPHVERERVSIFILMLLRERRF